MTIERSHFFRSCLSQDTLQASGALTAARTECFSSELEHQHNTAQPRNTHGTALHNQTRKKIKIYYARTLSRLNTTNKNFIAATDSKKKHSLSSCPERSKIAGVPLALQQLVLLPALSLLPALQLVLLSLFLVLEPVLVSVLSSLICCLPHLRVAQMKFGLVLSRALVCLLSGSGSVVRGETSSETLWCSQ